jgi:hypothetical protein
MTEFLITSYLYSCQDYNRQPTNASKLTPGYKNTFYLPGSSGWDWNLVSPFYHSFGYYQYLWRNLSWILWGIICRETENICMHVSLNTTDLQVPYPMMSSKSLLRDTVTSICVSGLIWDWWYQQ